MDLSQLSDAQLQQMAGQSPQQAAPDLSKLTDAQLQGMLPKEAPKEDAPVLNRINAIGAGAVGGAIEGAESLGGMANTILKNTLGRIMPDSVNQLAGDVSDKIKGALESQNPINNPTQVQAEGMSTHPELTGLAATAANLGTQGMALNAPLGMAGKALQGGIEATIPGAAASPVLTQALTQGTIGAGAGAVMNPEHPFKGALLGAGLGTITGAAGGVIAEQGKRVASIVARTVDDMVASGKDPMALPNIEEIHASVMKGGAELTKYDTQRMVHAQLNEALEQMRPPEWSPNEDMAKTISKSILNNYPVVKAQAKAEFSPIDSDTTQMQTPKFDEVLANVKDKLHENFPLPDDLKIQGQDTMHDLLETQSKLDDIIGSANRQTGTSTPGSITKRGITPYIQLRSAINDDIHAQAAQIPYTNPTNPNVQNLSDQLHVANDFSNQYIKPFQTLDKNGNPQTNIAAGEKIWGIVAKQIMSPRAANPALLTRTLNMLPQEGKSAMVYSALEIAMKKATSGEGADLEFNPNTFLSVTKRLDALGFFQHAATEDQIKMVHGLQTIITTAARNAPAGKLTGVVANAVGKLTQYRGGVKLLQSIGDKLTPPSIANKMTQQIVDGINGLKKE